MTKRQWVKKKKYGGQPDAKVEKEKKNTTVRMPWYLVSSDGVLLIHIALGYLAMVILLVRDDLWLSHLNTFLDHRHI